MFDVVLLGYVYSFLEPHAVCDLRAVSNACREAINSSGFWRMYCLSVKTVYQDPAAAFVKAIEVPVWYQHLLTNRLKAFGQSMSGRCPHTKLNLTERMIGKRFLKTGLVEAEVLTSQMKNNQEELALEVQFRDKGGELVGSFYRDVLHGTNTWPDKLMARSPVPPGTVNIELHFIPRTSHDMARNTCLQLALRLNTEIDRHTLPLLIRPIGSNGPLPHKLTLMSKNEGGPHLLQVELQPSSPPPLYVSPLVQLRLRCQTEHDSNMTLLMTEGPRQWSWCSTRNWNKAADSRGKKMVAGGITLAVADATFENPLTLRVSLQGRNGRSIPSLATIFIDTAVLTWDE
eukprot:Blabericola_migrator_1__647@NODE_115_length_13846_cov_473_148632_g103_i0_p5_GENE_NODE_115_length_13846_cov_473_148632_g103_i0NODE_115_length_13846_cov_473_148632_g103_i0_p5_ORF_typecomplete_len344_score42_37_NODE_115_length_13846_cov_473_148632_g103_i0923310264